MSFNKVIALILVVVLIGAGGFFILKTEKEDSNSMKSLYSVVEPLERKREALVAEKKNLGTDYALKTRDYGTVEILFTKLDKQIITDVWPIMRERGIVGVLGINSTEMPGSGGRLTHEDVQKLAADGWGLCFMVDKNVYNLENYLTSLTNMLKNQKDPVPTAIYFRNGGYDESYRETLKNSGIEIVITDAADGRSGTVSDVDADIWFTGAMPWGYTGSLADLELLGRTDGGNLVLTFETTELWSKTKSTDVDSQERQSFISALDSWTEYIYEEDPLENMETVGPTPYIYVDTNDPDVLHEIYISTLTPEQQLLMPKFRVTTVDTALALHREMRTTAEALKLENEAKQQSIDVQLELLEAEINSIYRNHGVASSKNQG